MTKDEIITFFKNRPEISINQVEAKLELPKSTLNKAVNGVRDLPGSAVPKLTEYIKSFCKLK